MPITIKGIRLNNVVIKRVEESGVSEIENAQYSLISSTDHVLAQQVVGGYGGLSLKPSPKTVKALRDFMESYHEDIKTVLGLE